jgi:hypothetical protein
MKPTRAGFVVTRVKAWSFRHPAVPFAVKGFEFRTPQPATMSVTARSNPSFAGTGRL